MAVVRAALLALEQSPYYLRAYEVTLHDMSEIPEYRTTYKLDEMA